MANKIADAVLDMGERLDLSLNVAQRVFEKIDDDERDDIYGEYCQRLRDGIDAQRALERRERALDS